jgi:hypothetical protein|tara:strand:- start:587 stop:1006 length:420 start_codon:yes stop_codon:yes gene_type:complete
MALQTITKDILTRTSGAALLELPYDICFIGGFDKDMAGEDVAARVYGEMVMARPGIFTGEIAYADTAPAGNALIIDVQKNGSTIYSTKPQFLNSGTLTTAGVFSGDASFASGNRITFKVHQTGSSTVGKGVRFMLKCKV